MAQKKKKLNKTQYAQKVKAPEVRENEKNTRIEALRVDCSNKHLITYKLETDFSVAKRIGL